MNVKINREETSQLISWGHWFAFFNIIICLIIASHYLTLSYLPDSLLGQIYAITMMIGHFSFLVFASYLLVLFPLSLVLRSYFWLRLIAVGFSTVGVMLLLADLIVYANFHLHINITLSEILLSGPYINPYLTITVVIGVLIIEYLIATVCWNRLRALSRRKNRIVYPALIIFIGTFFFSHIAHLWADANFYRPITMQKTNLPLSYPLTARHLLGKYGFLDEGIYHERLMEQGNPFSTSIEYPLRRLQFETQKSGQNLLLITVDMVSMARLREDMPKLDKIGQQNIEFTSHYSSGKDNELGTFSLFYGLAPNYYDAILASKKQAVLFGAMKAQSYDLSFFSANSMDNPLYKQALLSDYSPSSFASKSDNARIYSQWETWISARKGDKPWFSYLNFSALESLSLNQLNTKQRYIQNIGQIDDYIDRFMQLLSHTGMLDNTVVVVTANHNIDFDDKGKKVHTDDQNYNAMQFRVPLVIHWPDRFSESIDRDTSHVDIMQTLMHDLFKVKTPANYYSQGNNLFSVPEVNPLIYTGDSKNLVVIMRDDRLVRLDAKGRYRVYDYGYVPYDERLNILTFLRILKESKRFIAIN